MRRALQIVLIVGFTLTTLSLWAQQDKIAAQKKVIASLEKLLSEGEKQIASIRKDKSSYQSRATSLARQVEQRNRLLDAQQTQIDLLEAEIAHTDSIAQSLSSTLDHEREEYSRMVREAYRNYQTNSYVSYLFSAQDLADVARRLAYVRTVAELRGKRMEAIESTSQEIVEQQQILASRKLSLDSVASQLTEQRQLLQRDVNTARANLSNMTKREKEAMQQRQLAEQKLSAAIEQMRKLSKGNTQGASFSNKTSNLKLPVVGGRVKRYMDNMAEIVGQKGASIISIYDGKVVDVKQNRITGKYDIYIAHGEYITSYAGLDKASVAKGAIIKKNQGIGTIGTAVDVATMNREYKIVFGIYPPSAKSKMKASDCFK